MASQEASPFARLSTGIPALDVLLGGGIPNRAVTVIAGEPGSGKTILALQMLFHQARQGKRGLYLTTLSEPAIKLIHYAQGFDFFDPVLLDDFVVFADLGTSLRASGPEQALAEIVDRVEQHQPDLLIIDSFKAINELFGDPVKSRGAIYDLVVQTTVWGTTTLMLGEYNRTDVTQRPEFAIADGILLMGSEREGLSAVRGLEVLKQRGGETVTGRHFFELGANGLSVFPRVRNPEIASAGLDDTRDRAAFGVSGLDGLLGGGVPRGSATLLEGSTGTGKTLIGLHFLLEGARRGEPGALFTLEETPRQLRGFALNFGWDLAEYEASGLLLLRHTSPVELSTDRFLWQVREDVAGLGARRVVLDSLTGMALGAPSEHRYREVVHAAAKHFRATGTTLLMMQEASSMLGSAQMTGHGVLSSADNIVLMRYIELDGRLERAISVLKARGVAHSTELRSASIDDQGFAVGGPFANLQGVLTGIPVRAPQR